MPATKAKASLRIYAGSSEPSLRDGAMSIKIACAKGKKKSTWVWPGNIITHTPLTNPRHREEEPQNTNGHMTSVMQFKQSDQLFFPPINMK